MLSAAASTAAAAARQPASLHAARAFQRLAPAHVAGTIRCVGETFGGGLSDDPFTRAFRFQPHQWGEMTSSFIGRAAGNSLSTVAYNRATGEVDGCMVAEDWMKQPPALYRTGLPAEWHPVRALFRELYTAFDASPRAPPRQEGRTLQCLYFTCVRPSAQGAGVMKGLWRATIEAARDQGFDSIVATAGSTHVQQVLQEHLGFEEVASVDYARFAAASGHAQLADAAHSNPAQFSKLALLRRRVPSDLYV